MRTELYAAIEAANWISEYAPNSTVKVVYPYGLDSELDCEIHFNSQDIHYVSADIKSATLRIADACIYTGLQLIEMGDDDPRNDPDLTSTFIFTPSTGYASYEIMSWRHEKIATVHANYTKKIGPQLDVNANFPDIFFSNSISNPHKFKQTGVGVIRARFTKENSKYPLISFSTSAEDADGYIYSSGVNSEISSELKCACELISCGICQNAPQIDWDFVSGTLVLDYQNNKFAFMQDFIKIRKNVHRSGIIPIIDFFAIGLK